jgi:hypothetical protein
MLRSSARFVLRRMASASTSVVSSVPVRTAARITTAHLSRTVSTQRRFVSASSAKISSAQEFIDCVNKLSRNRYTPEQINLVTSLGPKVQSLFTQDNVDDLIALIEAELDFDFRNALLVNLSYKIKELVTDAPSLLRFLLALGNEKKLAEDLVDSQNGGHPEVRYPRPNNAHDRNGAWFWRMVGIKSLLEKSPQRNFLKFLEIDASDAGIQNLHVLLTKNSNNDIIKNVLALCPDHIQKLYPLPSESSFLQRNLLRMMMGGTVAATVALSLFARDEISSAPKPKDEDEINRQCSVRPLKLNL